MLGLSITRPLSGHFWLLSYQVDLRPKMSIGLFLSISSCSVVPGVLFATFKISYAANLSKQLSENSTTMP